MKESNLHIVIAAKETPRTEALKVRLIEKFSGVTIDVSVKDYSNIGASRHSTLICLIDLPGFEEPSYLIIERIKKELPLAKIITMHLYRSAELVNPLYRHGIHGYLFCEPSRKELFDAVTTVAAGKIFRPDFLTYP